jgi:hypothetical protein
MDFFLIVITTFEENFLTLNSIRRQQCQKYGIPVFFVYNGTIPEGFTLKEDELHCELPGIQGMNPIMFMKFLYAVTEFNNRLKRQPKFFVRCTATCFIDFKKIGIVLKSLPVHNCIAGPYDDKYENQIFCNGTCMVISNDVAQKLLKEDIFGNMMTLIENDDVTISWLGIKHGFLFDMTYWFSYFEGLTSLPEKLPEIPNKTVFYRIKNPSNRMTIDVGLWQMLEDRLKLLEN